MEQLKKELILETYEAFFQNPRESIFSDNCILTYVTTCISFSGSRNVFLQLIEYKNQINSKEEIVNLHITEKGLVSEVFSEIQFVNGPAWLVPGLDDNFYIDRKIHLLFIYIMEMDTDGKISSIHVFWDQSAVLKELEVISSNRRAWPIKLGKEQHYCIRNKENINTTYSKENQQKPSKKLSIFEPYEEPPREFYPVPVQPRSSAKPSLRPYEDLFVAKGTPISVKPPKACQKNHITMSKIQDIISNDTDSLEKNEIIIKKDPKYTHFEFNTPTEKELEEERRAILAKAKKGAALRSMVNNWDEYEQTPVHKPIQNTSNVTQENIDPDQKKTTLLSSRFYRADQTHFSFSDDTPTQETSAHIIQNRKYTEMQCSIFDCLSSSETQKENENIKKTDTITRLERDINAKWSFSED
ncbi:hypothetical protein PORY_002020 [Pneumocystis oryctolagi]|uniref:Uncharacterized protein n=1 Tax=Pneumocystis oryctolagi TaxID=42067 RepID=A0ACB7CC30_9ASCO|nr:hypothetical protein PORY_002020 [Pneumocystis oryctolagi]